MSGVMPQPGFTGYFCNKLEEDVGISSALKLKGSTAGALVMWRLGKQEVCSRADVYLRVHILSLCYFQGLNLHICHHWGLSTVC